MRLFPTFIAAALLGGCVTPEPIRERRDPPDWVGEQPIGDDQYEYFIGVGSDANGSVIEAEAAAGATLIEYIFSYLGVLLTVDLTAEDRSVLDDYRAEIAQAILQPVADAEFQIADRFIAYEDGDAITLYLLGRYGRGSLEVERERLQGLLYDPIEAVDLPTREGRQLESEGRYISALFKYIEAAQEAIASDIEHADLKFEDSIRRIDTLINRFVLAKVNDNLQTEVGVAFDSPFIAKLTSGVGGPPVSNAPILVSYKELRPDGRLGVRTDLLESDEEGMIEFYPPTPNSAGSDSITLWFDVSGLFGEVDPALATSMQPLIDRMLDRRVVFQYRTTATTVNGAIGIVIAELDIAGNLLTSDNTINGMIGVLTEAGVQTKLLSLDPLRLTSISDLELQEALRTLVGGRVELIVYGIATLNEFEEVEGGALAKVSGRLRVLEPENAQTLHTLSYMQRSRSSSPSGAIPTAFQRLGIRLGEELIDRLF